MATTPVTKYRPYLSLSELSFLISLMEEKEGSTDNKWLHPDFQSAKTALLKTKTLAELGLQKEAYKTNPRPSLSDRLGFGISTGGTTGGTGVPKDIPNFDEMMDDLNSLTNLKAGE